MFSQSLTNDGKNGDSLHSNLYLPGQNHFQVWSHTISATALGEYTIKKNITFSTLNLIYWPLYYKSHMEMNIMIVFY